MLELGRGDPSGAAEHAQEALEYAQLLERPTETLLAHAVLAQAKAASGDSTGEQEHMAAIAALDQSAAAIWARERVPL